MQASGAPVRVPGVKRVGGTAHSCRRREGHGPGVQCRSGLIVCKEPLGGGGGFSATATGVATGTVPVDARPAESDGRDPAQHGHSRHREGVRSPNDWRAVRSKGAGVRGNIESQVDIAVCEYSGVRRS